jgi:hypothetical protein
MMKTPMRVLEAWRDSITHMGYNLSGHRALAAILNKGSEMNDTYSGQDDAQRVLDSALGALRERDAKRKSLRAARAASKDAAELARELWMAAESGTEARIEALLESGALPTHIEPVGWDMRAASTPSGVMALGVFERAAVCGNERFLASAMRAGLDPFAHVDGWLELIELQEQSEILRSLSHPKTASWIEQACSKELSLQGAMVMQEWARRIGASLAGSSMNRFAWRPASALAHANPFDACSFAVVWGMLASWERWRQGKDVDDSAPLGVAKSLAARRGDPAIDQVDLVESWSMAIRLNVGPVSMLALSALGAPPTELDLSTACFNAGTGRGPLLLAALARQAYDVCSVLSKLTSQKEAATGASPQHLSWTWTKVLEGKQAKWLKSWGLSLVDLDKSALSQGAQAQPLLVGMMAQQGARHGSLQSALAIGRMEPELWFVQAEDGSCAFDLLSAHTPQEAAKIEAKILAKDSAPVQRRHSGVRRL